MVLSCVVLSGSVLPRVRLQRPLLVKVLHAKDDLEKLNRTEMERLRLI